MRIETKPGPTLAQAKTAKMGAILAAADDFLGQRCCGYTEMEKVSWEQQAQEATELATDPAVEAVDVSFTTPAGLESAKTLFQS